MLLPAGIPFSPAGFPWTRTPAKRRVPQKSAIARRTTLPYIGGVKILDALSRQPRALVWAGALVCLAIVGTVDYVTFWSISLFMFYAFIIFAVAWSLGWRDALVFIACCLGVCWFANYDSYLIRGGLRAYAWSMANRAVSFSFVAACANAIRSYRNEAEARVEAMSRARRLELEIVRSGESEQRRIGQDLHDGVCQNLSAIDCATECLRLALEAEGTTHTFELRDIQRMLRETSVELRSLAHAMSPVNLTGDGLPAAIEALVTTTNRLRQSSISVLADEEVAIADPAVAINLFRIAQEALSNAMKHAHATHVAVILKQTEGTLTLAISDDGCGLPPGAEASGGMGLHTMEYRAHLIGATISIETNESGGVSVTCVLPAPAAAAEPARNEPRESVFAPLAKAASG
jgi:signal transduction histidine kinase